LSLFIKTCPTFWIAPIDLLRVNKLLTWLSKHFFLFGNLRKMRRHVRPISGLPQFQFCKLLSTFRNQIVAWKGNLLNTFSGDVQNINQLEILCWTQ